MTASAGHGISIAEVFGPTVQGEGPHTGRRCAFIRLGLCNLDCAWCDTPYTWDWDRYDRDTELHRVTAVELLGMVQAMGVLNVVITGGEPLVQRTRLGVLTGLLKASGFQVEVETNGTIDPGDLLDSVDHWNVSPKLAHSGVDVVKRYHPLVLRKLWLRSKSAAFKFVCASVDDLAEVEAITREANIPPDAVWIMPEGRDSITLGERLRGGLAQAAIDHGYNVTGRLHVEVWGDKRGH